MARIQPKNAESPFEIHELFFSTTDRRGVILSGNEVFRRVSGFEMRELIGQPHNVIRHPDMPRCVFKLLWEYIQEGRPITAFVKNMAKDGSYYWVVANVFPLRDRFLSIRFKPSSPLLDVVKGAYQHLLNIERDKGVEESTRQLGLFLASKGFSNYDAFMRYALVEELNKRQSDLKDSFFAKQAGLSAFKMGNAGVFGRLSEIYSYCRDLEKVYQELYANIDGFIALNAQLESKSKYLLDLSEDIRLLSLNASVESNRLKTVGRTLQAVANEMKENSQQSAHTISSAADQITKVLGYLQQTIFEVSASKLQVEMVTFLVTELLLSLKASRSTTVTSAQASEIRQNISQLIEGLEVSTDRALESVRGLGQQLSSLSLLIRQIESFVKSAELIHINGNIETAKNSQAQGFRVIFERAIRLVKTAKRELDEFHTTIRVIRNEVLSIRDVDQVVGQSLERIESVVAQITS